MCICYWVVCMSSLYILDINLISEIWFVNIFFQFGCFSFYWLFPLTRRSFLFWCSPSFYLCFCFACSFEVISKKALPRPMSGSSSSLFSSRSFKFSGLRFNFLIHFELNCCVEEKLLASQSWVRSYDTVSETDSVLDPGKQ